MFKQQGIVSYIDSNQVFVNIDLVKGCQGCQAQSGCVGHQLVKNKQKRQFAIEDTTGNYAIGQMVTLAISKRSYYLALFLCYFLPIFLMVGTSMFFLLLTKQAPSDLFVLAIICSSFILGRYCIHILNTHFYYQLKPKIISNN